MIRLGTRTESIPVTNGIASHCDSSGAASTPLAKSYTRHLLQPHHRASIDRALAPMLPPSGHVSCLPLLGRGRGNKTAHNPLFPPRDWPSFRRAVKRRIHRFVPFSASVPTPLARRRQFVARLPRLLESGGCRTCYFPSFSIPSRACGVPQQVSPRVTAQLSLSLPTVAVSTAHANDTSSRAYTPQALRTVPTLECPTQSESIAVDKQNPNLCPRPRRCSHEAGGYHSRRIVLREIRQGPSVPPAAEHVCELQSATRCARGSSGHAHKREVTRDSLTGMSALPKSCRSSPVNDQSVENMSPGGVWPQPRLSS